ncbi:MAG TPA: hypothetical protein VFT12_13240, partial [Thermoanaerobaculia bacterium]|nr:hypothetical protein [Thermoanaerobaculia bacterium]
MRVRVTEDIRTICSCQAHARRERVLWRRSYRAARRTIGGLKARGLALIVSVPLALGALEFPTEAMHLAVTKIPDLGVLTSEPTRNEALSLAATATRTISELPIFTTDAVRQQFLSP